MYLFAEIEYFTLKLYNGGEMKENSKCYVGGSVNFFDCCNADEMSLIEIGHMLKEIGEFRGHFKL